MTKRKKRLSASEMKRQMELLRDRLFHDCLREARSGDVLPSENEIARNYNFSLAVTRNLYRQLSDEGIVQGQQGKGFFLTDKFSALSKKTSTRPLKIAIVCYIDLNHPDTPHASANLIFSGFEHKAALNRCQTKLFNLWPELDFTIDMLQTLKHEKVDGILYHGDKIVPTQKILSTLALLDIPLICAEKVHPTIHCVVFENSQIAKTGTEHLLSLGRRKLAFLQYSGDEFWQCQRRETFRELAAKAGAESFEFDMYRKVPFSQLAEDVAERILPTILEEEIDGVFCSGDIFAAALIDALKSTGKAIPKDIAIVGTDDDWSVRDYDITTIQTNHAFLGEVAFELMTEIVETSPSVPMRRHIFCPLVKRSTA